MNGHTALVTGGARGIGRAISSRLGADGCHVVINAHRDVDLAEQVADDIRSGGGQAVSIQADISNAAEVDLLFAAAAETVGPIDIVVNNAAMTEIHKPWLTIEEEEWDRLMAVNVKSCFLTARAAFDQMQRRRWGRIVNISSVVAFAGHTRLLHYTCSKAAMLGFTRALAREVAEHGITVNSVAPGAIATEAEAALVEDQALVDAEALRVQAIQRRGAPLDVAGAVSFLVSEDASFVTGQTIIVDGGWVMR